jgi:hypothetical protein
MRCVAWDFGAAFAAGADLRDARGRRLVPLGPASIRKLIDTLAAILDDAIEDGHIDRNPARGKRMRVRVPKPRRTFLELDELAAVIDAAAMQDAPSTPPRVKAKGGATATLVAERLSRGMSQSAIAVDLGIAKSTSTGTHAGSESMEPATPAVRSSSAYSATAACATPNSAISAFATCGCTSPAAPAFTSRTPRPRRASGSSR